MTTHSKGFSGILIIVIALFVGIIPLLPFFIIHEMGHALAALILGVRITQINFLTHVETEKIENPLVFWLVGVSGGFFQAIVSTLFFVVVDRITDSQRRYLTKLFSRSLELVLLVYTLYGVFNGVVEGFFPVFYSITNSSTLLWGSVFLISGVIAFFLLYKSNRVPTTS